MVRGILSCIRLPLGVTIRSQYAWEDSPFSIGNSEQGQEISSSRRKDPLSTEQTEKTPRQGLRKGVGVFIVLGIGQEGSLKEERDSLRGISMSCTHFLLPLWPQD